VILFHRDSLEALVVTPGHHLRTLREQLGLTMRDVETASARVAARHGNDDFAISLSRLSDIETKGIVPSIYRLYTLAVVYRYDVRELMGWYGIDVDEAASDMTVAAPPKSHLAGVLESSLSVRIPVRVDPSLDLRRTVNLGRLIEQWGVVPLAYLEQFANSHFSYGYIGSEDFTMYPILQPGSFVQIDESKNKVLQGMWRSEYERPIYFVETRSGHTCCWCALKGDQLVLQPHPLSPMQVRVLRHPQDAEVIGQVVGVAMKLGEWSSGEPVPNTKEPAALN
jgi:transcriptional regulator with XRE-family HTH domain